MPGPGHRPALKLLAAPALAALCGCSAGRLDLIQVGPWFPARTPAQVEVFASRSETKVPWGAIGIIHGPRVTAGSPKLEKHKAQARAAAARMGADALLLTVETGTDDRRFEPIAEPEVFLSGLAIKYVPDAKPPAEQP